MKKQAKILLMVLLMTLAVLSFGVISSASDVVYTVTSADGTVVEYTDPSEFSKTFSNAKDGDTITLNADIEIENGLSINGKSESEQRTVYLDLAGHGIYAFKKINLFSVGSYVTLNVYSSKENAILYDEERGSFSKGGNIFTAGSETGKAVINCGTMTINGVEYPGSNITTFSSCFVQVGNAAESEIYVDGGTHIANVKDWNAFICHRSSAPKITIKNANLLIDESNAVVASIVEGGEILLENCSIFRLDGEVMPLFNQVLGKTTIRNCEMNFSVSSVGTNNLNEDSVILEGENIFGSAEFNALILKDSDGKVIGYTDSEYRFENGEDKLQCYGRFLGENRFYEMEIDLPSIKYACASLIDEEDAVEYVWRYGDREESYIWKKGLEPKAPFIITGSAEEGLYKLGWYEMKEDGKIVYVGGNVLDFGIKVNVEYTYGAFINIYIPAFTIDKAYLDFSGVSLDGSPLNKKSWVYEEIDGVGYYKTSTVDIFEEPEKVFALILTCDFGNDKIATKVWQISATEYFEKIHSDESNYTADELEAVEELEKIIFGE